ncbi:hypothetical protein PAECIP111893_01991 [Paenibacillus plantiphilus]|uniref:DUF4179 domain-containing protein n=1 Tax=Paenibacillus plantiphilus TaxID=2905650 RepID=A0ABM9C5W8_9BACL|nr:DUF4179 domain-containing protein [Paenibacillus plantiphilus]CAH1203531.1 hypothetical protein PAECIP111893_01991 [Paenibacillus plantiphilus]
MKLNVERELEGLKEHEVEELPEMIRSRLDFAYLSLETNASSQIQVTQPKRRQRRIITIFAWAAASILLIIGSGFISPVMANALNKLPFIGSLFGYGGDKGLQIASEQGLTTNVNASMTHDGVTFSISEYMYDGTRISMVLTRETSDGRNEPLKEWWEQSSEENIDRIKNGEEGSGIVQIWADDQRLDISLSSDIRHNNSAIITAEPYTGLVHNRSLHLPDKFNLKVIVHDATIQQNFNMQFPVLKSSQNNIVLTSEELKQYNNFSMKMKKIEITKATMRMEASISGKTGQDLEAFSDSLMYDIWNEQGESALLMSGSSETENTTALSTAVFVPFPTLPKSIVVKPYIAEGKEKMYIPELEFTLPVQQ